MIKLPKIVGLTLCERIDVNRETGQVSLVGLVQVFHFPIFPSPAKPFTVYLALFDGVGEGTMELSIMQLATEKVIYRYQRWLAFPGRDLVVNQEIPVRRCVFPTPGRYLLTLSFDQQPVTQRTVTVFLD